MESSEGSDSGFGLSTPSPDMKQRGKKWATRTYEESDDDSLEFEFMPSAAMFETPSPALNPIKVATLAAEAHSAARQDALDLVAGYAAEDDAAQKNKKDVGLNKACCQARRLEMLL